MVQSEVNRKDKREIQLASVKDTLLHANWCELITENENKQETNHDEGIDFINKTKLSANKKRRINDHAQFESVSSEIIYNDAAMLNPTNNVSTTLKKVVAQSNALREKRKVKRPKNHHNHEINSRNNQNYQTEVQHFFT